MNLLLIGNKFVISGTTPEDKEPIKAIPGSDWSSRMKAWCWKADYKTYKQILISFPSINVSEDVKIWVQKHLRGIQKLKSLKGVDPSDLSFNI